LVDETVTAVPNDVPWTAASRAAAIPPQLIVAGINDVLLHVDQIACTAAWVAYPASIR